MFGNKKVNYDTASTVIGSEVTIQGTDFTGSGTIRIDGKYIGNMNIDGGVVIGAKGVINGNITAKHVLVGGNVNGDISCENDICLATTANVQGNLKSVILVVDEGAVFNGNCTILRDAQNSRKQESNPNPKPKEA